MPAPKSGTQTNGNLKSWLSILDEFDVQFLVLDTHRDRDLCQIVQSQPGWTVDLQVEKKILFARTSRPGENLVAA